MSQEGVLNLLLEIKWPLSCKELSEKLGIGPGSINQNMRGLLASNEVRYFHLYMDNSKVKRYYYATGTIPHDKIKHFESLTIKTFNRLTALQMEKNK